MIRIRTASRLHFGLLNLSPADRRFGGVGMMIEQPGVQVSLRPDTAWRADGPLAERALDAAQRFLSSEPKNATVPQRITVESAPRAHVGLGTGTQLALAVAKALAVQTGRGPLSSVELAHRVGRGKRSAIGVHGFDHGGLLVDGGKIEHSGIAPLVSRHHVPDSWRVILTIPRQSTGLHGLRERAAFDEFRRADNSDATADRLCRLVLLGILPALAEADLPSFAEAVQELNVRVGQAFAPQQGGVYCNSAVGEIVDTYARVGIRGAGQSSWGPTVFGFVADETEADPQAARLRRMMREVATEVIVTKPFNQTAAVSPRPSLGE